VTLEGQAAGRIRLTSARFPGEVDLRADGCGPVEGWGRYVAAVAVELDAVGRPAIGFTGRLTSDLPAGAGLSSSAALEVVIGTALCAIAEFPLESLELAKACQRAEHRAVGLPSGIMDQAASLLGRADSALLLDCGSLSYHLVPLPADLALLVIDSGVSRDLAGSGYAQRRRELEEGHPRRVRHVVTENARVLAVAEALRRDDRGALREQFAAGHESLRDDYEVSTQELDLLVELSLARGAVAARMTGGGFGGAIVALADVGRADEIGGQITAAYRARTGRAGAAYRCRASNGAREI
jgi:galactokinase